MAKMADMLYWAPVHLPQWSDLLGADVPYERSTKDTRGPPLPRSQEQDVDPGGAAEVLFQCSHGGGPRHQQDGESGLRIGPLSVAWVKHTDAPSDRVTE
ncbi:hypothetical protein NDU88_002043 [Pleurodeles waltl]|uniref:Uncharacterized protein n=1 Tax=Pleurodeles waltl TaxID=8319 RepID=A0AAV7UA51_PLEWA|nr:hypothetical protein NDU88_002043 [Pleurodeles waltl]